MTVELEKNTSVSSEVAADTDARAPEESAFENAEATEAATADDAHGELKLARRYAASSVAFVKRLGRYETRKLEYTLHYNKYRYTPDPNASDKYEKSMKKRISATKRRVAKALRYERSDNRRYVMGIALDSGRVALATGQKRELIEEKKRELLTLLEERDRINEELAQLYSEKYKEYIGRFKDKRFLSTKLHAAKKAYKKLKEVEREISNYIFTPEDKARIFASMNKSIEIRSEIAVLKQKRAAATGEQRDDIRREISSQKRELASVRRSISSLLAKAKRRTYFYGEGGIVRWVVAIAVLSALLIAAFLIFYEPIMNLYQSIT